MFTWHWPGQLKNSKCFSSLTLNLTSDVKSLQQDHLSYAEGKKEDTKSSWLYRSYRMTFVTLDTVGVIYSLDLNFAFLGSQKCCHCFLCSLPWPLLSFLLGHCSLAMSERCGCPSQRRPNFCSVPSVHLKPSKSETYFFSLGLWGFWK